MELRHFLIICLIYVGDSFQDEMDGTKIGDMNELSKKIPLSTRRRHSKSAEKNSEEKSSDESIDRSPTNHLPYSDESHRHSHSPYVHMVFKLAAEAVDASDASQRISHELSMNHGQGHGHGHNVAMVKVRVPLYKQSYPVLFQHGHIMHDMTMDGLPYPYVPTMKARPSTIRQGHTNRNSNRENNYGAGNINLVSHGLALAHGQRNGHQAPHY